MPFDGLVLSNIVSELKNSILGGRVDKFYQTEKDEIIFSIRKTNNNKKLLLSASSSYPRACFTTVIKDNPQNPPMFCMLLRKHLNGGKIINIIQPSFERILEIHIESLNEMGDMSTKRLILEIMGRHSNIILVNENNTILDSIKHISLDKSSVRPVLPGQQYVLPPSNNKISPINLDKDCFKNRLLQKNISVQKSLYQNYNGLSPLIASEICIQSNINFDLITTELSENQIDILYDKFRNIINNICDEQFNPIIFYDENNNPIDFYCFKLNCYKNYTYYDSISEVIENFYKLSDILYRTKQKTVDLRKIVNVHMERCLKKKELQNEILQEVENRDNWKLFGDLITSNIYSIKKGMQKFTTVNFYSENLEEIEIPLDPNLTPSENAQKYFKKYNKQKRTFIALQEQIKNNDLEIIYLDNLIINLSGALNESDIEEIRDELIEQGYIKKQKNKKFKIKKSKPLHYISSDNFDIYVGKNNRQNDDLTTNFASNNDIWLHTKNIAGSHVIIKTNGQIVPDTTLSEAAHLAAYYSKGQNSSLVPVDYTPKKFVKKPNGAKPGMVIYESNKTIFITPDINIIKCLKEIS